MHNHRVAIEIERDTQRRKWKNGMHKHRRVIGKEIYVQRKMGKMVHTYADVVSTGKLSNNMGR